ncbi:signal peptidase I [Aneurinibacillus sp. Ricciae_BoGa-3]|uniref:signal peptidase I n=1 Tax=Aneurinibacillus sp. Ricciae_BoGa-3 TaxID=3022697 RepID=UPI0023402AAA|nr:signal peptidase I [Aneurinibacillus sp. Ricciae_BoGa-3]WCK56200.1 signal peptidase I [Aneurinibacillus sp. Ricciae_BoGa-3]
MRKFFKEWSMILVTAFILSTGFRTYVAEAVKVPTGSMLPTIHLEDRLVVNKMSNPDNYNYGDVVVFYPPVPGAENERYVKRLIGKGGDVIQIKDHALYRNGQLIKEPYIKEPMNYEYGPVTVPKGKFFFLGDNRNDSYDSHLWPTPFVDKSKISGKVEATFFPFSDMRTF